MNTNQRLAIFEQGIDNRLPQDYRAFVAVHRADPEQPGMVVGNDPDYWGVRDIYELADGPESVQLDLIHDLVGDVIPAGMIAIADDNAGNLYLLDCRDGPQQGAVYWWNHERESGDNSVDLVACSFYAFFASLGPDWKAVPLEDR